MRRAVTKLHNRKARRRLASLRRSAAGALFAAVVAGASFLAAGPAGAVALAWTPGIGAVSFTGAQLDAGVAVDINGDGYTDFVLEGSNVGAGYGSSIALRPTTVNSINNEVFSDGSGVAVTAFANDLAVLDALFAFDPTVAASASAILWDDTTPFSSFESPGAIAGILFEVPGGSPYVAYLQMEVFRPFGIFDSLSIHESGYQVVPEPGTSLLVGSGLLALGWSRPRRLRGRREN